ncbi:hypothetical protein N2152v2_007828 [Parachlorella kessleri]
MDGFSLFSSKAKKKNRAQQHPKSNEKEEALTAAALNMDDADENGHHNVTQAARDSESQQQVEPETFKQLGLNDWLARVCSSLGMQRPTQVQQGCIPAILAGRSVIGVAHTGSGKTAAFALPILQKLAKDPFGVFGLVLTPTRELAFQIGDQFRALGAGMSLKDCVVVGGLDMQAQAKALARRPHVVIATPGRLKGLLDADSSLGAAFSSSHFLSPALHARLPLHLTCQAPPPLGLLDADSSLGAAFSRARFLVLDEADRLLEPSFEAELAAVLGTLPGERQTLLFSATMTKALVALQKTLLEDAFHFQAYEGLQTAKRLREQYLFLPAKVKEVYLVHLLATLEQLQVRSVMVFTSTCKGCHLLSLLLEQLELPCAALHSHQPQRRRLTALDKFKSGAVPVLLATDVASRGLDIPTVDLVVNYDLPVLARDYVHRVGRTARAGREGWSLSFITQYDIDLVHKIEELIGKQLDKYECDEAEVLKGITKVYAAKRAAAMRADEEALRDGSFAKQAQRKRKQAA